MRNLNGKRVLVTGSGMGIGRGVAVELARRGASVAVHHPPNEPDAAETVSEIEALGAKYTVVRGDLSGVSECSRIVDEAAAALGGLDSLVNNSGITRDLDFLDTDEATFDEVFDVNIKGAFFCARRAVHYMLEAGGGSILNLSSIHGGAGFPKHAAYAATKGAIVAFTRELAVELAQKRIRVNAVAPGIIEVPRYFDMPGYTTEFGHTLVPWGRVGTPEDIGRSAAFLLSDDADFITGQILYVDGGTNARMGLWWEKEDASKDPRHS